MLSGLFGSGCRKICSKGPAAKRAPRWSCWRWLIIEITCERIYPTRQAVAEVLLSWLALAYFWSWLSVFRILVFIGNSFMLLLELLNVMPHPVVGLQLAGRILRMPHLLASCYTATIRNPSTQSALKEWSSRRQFFIVSIGHPMSIGVSQSVGASKTGFAACSRHHIMRQRLLGNPVDTALKWCICSPLCNLELQTAGAKVRVAQSTREGE